MKLTANLAAITLSMLGLSQSVFATQTDVQVVLDTFAWFNTISSEARIAFSEKDISGHFTKDAKMITNNKLACQGITEHFDHFVELNQHFKTMQVDINHIDARQSGDRVYLDYTIHAVNDKEQAVNIHVMGYMVIKDKRIALFKEIVSLEEGGDKNPVAL